MTIILFVLIFGVVVISHEFGHFLLAKANGIHVVEFSVGMGPTLLSFRKGDTVYSLKLFPIGGACMFEGEDGVKTKEETTEEGVPRKIPSQSGSFTDAGVWARISCVLAGPVFNFLLAFIVAFIMVNMVIADENSAFRDVVVSTVQEGSPAEAAGLRPGDRFLSIDGDKTYLYEDIFLFGLTADGTEVPIVYERDGERYETALTPVYDAESERFLMGVGFGEPAQLTAKDSVRYAFYEMRYSAVSVVKSLGMMIRGQVDREDVAGPVGIAAAVGETYETAKAYGWSTVVQQMLNFTLLLSVNLGILNLLPLPALDGGRMVFLLLEVLRGKPVPPEKEGMVHFIGLIFFMALMVLVLFNDIVNIFG